MCCFDFQRKHFFKICKIQYCISPYLTQGSRIYDNLAENNGILLIENNIMEMQVNYPECYFFLAGDFNACTKDFNDFIPRDDLHTFLVRLIMR